MIISTALRSGNDVANSIAPVLELKVLEGETTATNLWLMLLLGGLGLALGLISIGRIVIRVVAKEILEMNPTSGFSAILSVTIVMTIDTLLGYPLSGTHVLIAAMIAVGWAERAPIQKEMVRNIIISWIVTVPIAAGMGAVLFFDVDYLYNFF